MYSESEFTISEQWQQFLSLGHIPWKTGSALDGVICVQDSCWFEYICVIEVDSFATLSADLGCMRISVNDYAFFSALRPCIGYPDYMVMHHAQMVSEPFIPFGA